MTSRPLIIASLLGASIGVPYITSNFSKGDGQVDGSTPDSSQSVTTSSPSIPWNAPTTTTQMPVATSSSAPPTVLDGPRFQTVAQFLRFDLTKQWIYSQWDRKSTGPTDVGLFSVRVPLVMGTQTTSLAGSLTYYFSTHNQIEHISFSGTTADTTQLVQFLVRTYEFQRVESPVGEQVYQVARRGRVQSELRTRTEPVLDSKSPLSTIKVELELARPGSARFLPARGPNLPIPPAPSTPAPPSGGDSADSGDSYFDKVRYATPQEQDQVLWKRWPN